MNIPGSAAAVLVAAALCFSCVSKRHADIINARSDSIRVSTYERERIYGELFGALDRLTTALAESERLERDVRTGIGKGNLPGRSEGELHDDVHRLAELMVRCRAEMQVMQRGIDRLGNESFGLSHLKAVASRLQRQVDGHRESVRELRKNVYSLPHFQISYTDDGSVAPETDVLSNNDMLHTAYYIIGTYKELHGRNIVRRTHLFWGPYVVDEDSPLDCFDKVDAENTAGIDIGKNNARIVSSHPPGSYRTVERNGTLVRIEIKDSRRFWSLSKVLVVAYR